MFTLDAFQEILSLSGVSLVRGDQCRFGACYCKPTAFLCHGVDTSELSLVCNHPSRWWTDVFGEWTWGAHPPLKGRGEDGTFLTRTAAAYPKQLNETLAG
eukprot:2567416-Amphidinium_carterae.1